MAVLDSKYVRSSLHGVLDPSYSSFGLVSCEEIVRPTKVIDIQLTMWDIFFEARVMQPPTEHFSGRLPLSFYLG